MKNRKSIRLEGYDYTKSGIYFITICTKDRVHYFGKIQDNKMILNELGIYITNHRKQINNHYPNIYPEIFICMPNHIHGIIKIDNNIKNENGYDVGKQFFVSNQIQPKSGSLGSIIRGFKIGITKYAKENNIVFQRQGRFHDHIIRDEIEYEKIKEYIKTNPQNRKSDSFY